MADENLDPGQTNTDTGGDGNGADDASSTILTGDDKGENPGGDKGGDGGDDASKGDKGDKGKGENDGSGAEGDGAGDDDSNPGVPESYEFIMPEGMEMDKALAEAAAPVFKDLELSQEQANKLTTAYAEAMANNSTAIDEAFVKQQNDWKAELKTDQDFGGDKFDENSGQVALFINKTCPAELLDEVKQMLMSSGAANHPATVKYFHSLAKAFPVGEDSPDGGTSTSKGKKPLEDRMYPNEANQSQ